MHIEFTKKKHSPIYYFLYSILLLTLASCSTQQKEIDQAEQQLMQVHDDGMAKMDELMSLEVKLKAVSDSSANENIKATASEKIIQLKKADESMMVWMRNYKKPGEKEKEEVALKYFKEEFVKMKEIKIQMDSSIQSAKNFLQNL